MAKRRLTKADLDNFSFLCFQEKQYADHTEFISVDGFQPAIHLTEKGFYEVEDILKDKRTVRRCDDYYPFKHKGVYDGIEVFCLAVEPSKMYTLVEEENYETV